MIDRKSFQFIQVCPPSEMNVSCLICFSSRTSRYSYITGYKPSSLPTPIQNNLSLYEYTISTQ